MGHPVIQGKGKGKFLNANNRKISSQVDSKEKKNRIF